MGGDTTRLTTSGRVQASDGIYVERQADADLLEVCREGRLGVVLHSRQVGKSSLISHAASRLRQEGFVTVSIDFTVFGVHEVKVDDWYLAIVDEVASQLGVDVDTDQWWDEAGNRPPVYKLVRFLGEAILPAVPERIVVFMDEIDTTLSLPFTDDLFAAIRQCYQRRDEDEQLRRLSFVLVGSSSPTQLMKDEKRTPFNIGTTIDIRDFSRLEVQAFAPAFDLSPAQVVRVLGWVHDWSGGHPYLTQVLCAHVVEEGLAAEPWGPAEIEELVQHVFLSSEGEQDFNLDNVRDMLTDRWVRQGGDQRALLELYYKVRKGRRVKARTQTDVVQHLLLSGVVVSEGAHLRVRNRIYAEVFSPRWIRYHMPTNWRAIGIGVGTAAAIVLMAVAMLHQDDVRKEQRNREWRGLSTNGLHVSITGPKGRIETKLAELDKAADPAAAAGVRTELSAELTKLRELEPRLPSAQLAALEEHVDERYAALRSSRAQQLRELAEAKAADDLRDYALLHATAAWWLDRDVDDVVVARVDHEYGDVTAVMQGHTSPVTDADFSPDGTRLVTASEDFSIRLWDVATGLPVGSPVATKNDASFRPEFIGWQRVAERDVILTTSRQDPYVMLELRAGADGLRRSMSTELGTLALTARLSPDGHHLLTAGLPTILWSYPDLTVEATVPRGSRRSRSPVNDARFSPDGTTIAALRSDGVVELLDGMLEERRDSLVCDAGGAELAKVRFYEGREGERWLLTVPFVGTPVRPGDSSGTVQIWSLVDGSLLKRVQAPTPRTIDARLCPPPSDAKAGTAATLTIVGLDASQPVRRIVQRLDVRTSPDESDSDQGAPVTIADISPRARIETDDEVWAISPSCTSVATVGTDNLVKVRSLDPVPRRDRSGRAMFEYWQRLFQRTVAGSKIAESDSRQEASYNAMPQRRGGARAAAGAVDEE
ncbi:MAG: AAA-like domain-containing protein [Myxococcales bacterium]|nr:AAA-like domain-containing protein [Myxococcales bacterium]MCB9713933.1 AAA-like domain-containing protein [Myxococcales bacterium]